MKYTEKGFFGFFRNFLVRWGFMEHPPETAYVEQPSTQYEQERSETVTSDYVEKIEGGLEVEVQPKPVEDAVSMGQTDLSGGVSNTDLRF